MNSNISEKQNNEDQKKSTQQPIDSLPSSVPLRKIRRSRSLPNIHEKEAQDSAWIHSHQFDEHLAKSKKGRSMSVPNIHISVPTNPSVSGSKLDNLKKDFGIPKGKVAEIVKNFGQSKTKISENLTKDFGIAKGKVAEIAKNFGQSKTKISENLTKELGIAKGKVAEIAQNFGGQSKTKLSALFTPKPVKTQDGKVEDKPSLFGKVTGKIKSSFGTVTGGVSTLFKSPQPKNSVQPSTSDIKPSQTSSSFIGNVGRKIQSSAGTVSDNVRKMAGYLGARKVKTENQTENNQEIEKKVASDPRISNSQEKLASPQISIEPKSETTGNVVQSFKNSVESLGVKGKVAEISKMFGGQVIRQKEMTVNNQTQQTEIQKSEMEKALEKQASTVSIEKSETKPKNESSGMLKSFQDRVETLGVGGKVAEVSRMFGGQIRSSRVVDQTQPTENQKPEMENALEKQASTVSIEKSETKPKNESSGMLKSFQNRVESLGVGGKVAEVSRMFGGQIRSSQNNVENQQVEKADSQGKPTVSSEESQPETGKIESSSAKLVKSIKDRVESLGINGRVAEISKKFGGQVKTRPPN